MKLKNLIKILALNVLGTALLLSWYLPENHGFWFAIDKYIFYFFNDLLPVNKVYMYFVAFINLRFFDIVDFLFMLLIFYSIYRKMDAEGRRYMFCMGLTMLISAIIVKQFDNSLSIDRASPTAFFSDANRVSILSGWPAKDKSATSFPGDHGMMLLIFSSFMLRYFGRKPFLQSLLVFIVFSLPRIMGGAHWFTDLAVGAVSVILIVMSWILLTPFSDRIIKWLESKVPLKYFGKNKFI